MTLNDTVLYSLIRYKDIIHNSNALDIYDSLFCVNGNGYYWKNGELINDSIDTTFPIYDYIDHAVTDSFNDFKPKDFKFGKTIYKFEFYPLSQHSCMCTFPDDIKPDWFAGIKKMVELIETHTDYINADDYNKTIKWLDFVKEKIRKHEAAL